jgi:hypothetical protein
MKIINREEFLKLPENTLFCKYKPCCFDDISIKNENVGDIDFRVRKLFDVDNHDSNEMVDILFDAEETGNYFKLHFNTTYRDGLFDKDQLFAIFDNEEILQLIENLKRCIK